MPHHLSRRSLLTALPGLSAVASTKPLTIVVAGGHPDDPETGAGGTMANYARLGHIVIALYLTRGEAGIPGVSHAEAATIRTAEAQQACSILGAKPLFAGQIDGAAEVNGARYAEFASMLEKVNPDVVLTHFPIDTHRDHRAVSMLVYDALQRSKRKFPLYYFEVLTGEQTQNFNPTIFVDITSSEPSKRKACYAHKSQNPGEFYPAHERMSLFRGLESGVKHAEAFVPYALNSHQLP